MVYRPNRWPPEREEFMLKLFHEGKSSSYIAKMMGDGMTRNGVIGKLHRLGFIRPRAEKRIQVKTVQRRQTVLKRGDAINNVLPEDRPPQIVVDYDNKPSSSAIAFESLGRQQCRWPIGEVGKTNFHFCGHQVQDGRVYCKEHVARAYVKPSQYKRRVEQPAG